MKKISIKTKHVLYIMVFLLLAVSVLLWQHSSGRNENADAIRILHNGQVLHTFTMDEIKGFNSVSIEKSIASGKGENEEGNYTGVPLSRLLDRVDPDLLKEGKQIVSRAQDGFESAYTPEEVREENNILVIYSKDGDSLGTAKDGGSGPFRIIVAGDPFGNRSTKYLNEIEVK